MRSYKEEMNKEKQKEEEENEIMLYRSLKPTPAGKLSSEITT